MLCSVALSERNREGVAAEETADGTVTPEDEQDGDTRGGGVFADRGCAM